jgi:hypothetical protein
VSTRDDVTAHCHPADLPTLLPPGVVRVNVVAARLRYHYRLRRRLAGDCHPKRLARADRRIVRRLDCQAADVSGDCKAGGMPAGCVYKPVWAEYRKPGSALVHRRVVGHVVFDQVSRTLAFNVSRGIPQGRLPMIAKLDPRTFVSLPTGTIYLFAPDGTSCDIAPQGVLNRGPATRLLRLLEDTAAKEARRWDKLFPPDVRKRGAKDKTVPPSKRRNGRIEAEGND